jgi:NADP-dependent 3-hydroxy acid dehydrogenase YdfG
LLNNRSQGKANKKIVWITGSGSGLGKEMALQFAREGAMVAVSGRRKDKLETTVQEIEAEGGQGLVVPCDVSNEEEIIETILLNYSLLIYNY